MCFGDFGYFTDDVGILVRQLIVVNIPGNGALVSVYILVCDTMIIRINFETSFSNVEEKRSYHRSAL